MPEIIILVIGLAAALKGADWVGKAAVSWSRKYGLSQVIIGATVVSFATTLPEISIAFISGTFNKEPQIGLGTVLGSTLANLGLILGLFFLFSRERPKIGYYTRTLNIFVLLAVLLLVISTNTIFGGMLSLLLVVLGVSFLLLEFLLGKRSVSLEQQIFNRFEGLVSLFDFSAGKREIVEFLMGTLLLSVGSKFAVDSISSLASSLRVSELILSLTLVALGTSLPELITAFNSLLYKREDISIGNLIGASVIDLSIGVGGATLFHPTQIASPTNYLIFSPMILIGFIGLFAVWKKVPLKLIGVLLISVSLLFLAILTINGFN